MKVAAKKGKLKGDKPKLSPAAERHLVALYRAGDHSISELCDLFSIVRATVYRAVDRHPIQESGQVTLPRVDDGPEKWAHPRL
ncbi:helix-turn-helix domain-containing protein [Clavibacter michiganensis]|uniref:helix-turn-helix domain-containing protein n=1 Tax=Clavibacter michiganensis TaxID=28447 RepID=UPI000AD684B7|nr:helix-turn-helix domain-containing protein [Clavibacter michiganensis]